MIGQMIEDLCIANTKLFELCNTKADMAKNPDKYTKKQMVEIMAKDISLCKRRASLKSSIDKKINQSIIDGGLDTIEEIKNYGK